MKASTSGSTSACFQNLTGRKWNCRSGSARLAAGPGEQPGLGEVGGQRPAAGAEPLRVARRATRRGTASCPTRTFQITGTSGWSCSPPPTPGQVVDDVDADLAQVVAGPDAREHQQLRGVDRAAGEHHLAGRPARCARRPPARYSTPVARPPSTSTRVVSAPVRTVRLGRVSRRVQVGVGRRPAPAALLRHLVLADALLGGAVEVVVARVAGGDRGLDDRAGPRVRRAQVLDPQRAADAVEAVGAAGVVLHPAEQRQHVLVGPGLVAGELRPLVVVGRRAADVDHRVDRRGAAEQLAARPEQLAAAEPGLRLGRVVPVAAGAPDLVERRPGSAPRARRRSRRPRAAAPGSDGSSVSRPASAQPAEPAPTTTTSNSLGGVTALTGAARGSCP